MVAERKYVLTKLAAGDYLLPSNDGKTVWRISKHIDGPSLGLDDWPRDREVWALYRWTGTDLAADVVSDSWARWSLVADWLDTRAAAIAEALS